MKLLFDNNLAARLVLSVAERYPGSAHVAQVGLVQAPDDLGWQYAREHGFLIVSKDSDFHQRSLVEGFPPKVVWIQRGNCTTGAIADLLRDSAAALQAFEEDTVASFLVLE